MEGLKDLKKCLSALMISALIFKGIISNAQNTIPAAISTTAKINYSRTWSAEAPEQSTSNLITRPLQDVKQSTQYFDGFGRPIQNVQKQASPLGSDLVVANNYDLSTGIETYKYLQFAVSSTSNGDITNDGNFKTDRFHEQVSFYNSYLAGQVNETSSNSTTPNWAYAKTNYELSPLNRPLNSYAPGYNWVGSEGTSKHNIQKQFLLNTSTDNVRKWDISLWVIGSPQSNILPSSTASYNAGALYKTIYSDEQGHQTIEFKDTYGQTILKKVQVSSAVYDDGVTGSPHSGWLCTYYVYDDFGNIRFVITPKEVQLIDGSWVITQAQADELCFRYEYDAWNHMVVKKVPGAGNGIPSGNTGEIWMVYDQRNRLVMEQDGNLRSEQKWRYIQYDNLDRVIATGLITDPSHYSDLSFNVSGASTSTSWPTTSSYPTIEVLTQSFYDSYSAWMNVTNSSTLTSTLDASTNGSGNSNFIAASNTTAPYPQSITQSKMIRGLILGSKTEVLDKSGYIYVVKFFDSKGREIQSQTLNITGGKEILTNQYDWSGRVLNSLVSNQNGSSVTPQMHNAFTFMVYDAMGRLLTIKKSVNSIIKGNAVASTPSMLTIVSNSYDELGRLKSKQLAPYFTNINATGMEKLTYDYNVRGWLLGVNRDYAKTPLSTSNYFGYDIGYDQTAISPTGGSSIGSYAAAVYNGNIEGSVWKSRGDGVARRYDYSYDYANRLLSATYNESTSINSWGSTYINFSVNSIQYDGNGNLSNMQQYGFLVGGAQPIDNLTYNYINTGTSNKLLNVQDNSTYNSSVTPSVLGDLQYTGSKAATATDFAYDNNGNVTTDNNRFETISYWDCNNLPKLITIAGTKNNSTIQYIYDATGNKLKKITIDKSVAGKTITTTTTYLSGFVYKSVLTNPAATTDYTDILQYFGHDEGRIRFIPSGTTGSFVFDYFVRDQLGSVRVVLTDEQQTDYYFPATLENTTYQGGTAISQETSYYNIKTAAPSDVVPNPSWLANAQNGTYTNQNGSVPNIDPYSNTTANSTQLYQLCGNTGNNPSGDRYGLGITLKVTAGDKISIYGKSVWHLPTGQSSIPNGSYPLSDLLTSLLTVFANTTNVIAGGNHMVTAATITSSSSSATSLLTSELNSANIPGNSTTTPKAGINWILFDNQFRPVASSGGSGFDPVYASSDYVKSHNLLSIPMIESGYLYVFCSNESNINVYFDNLQVTNTRGPLAEETSYYPFGLSMAGISDHAWNKQANYEHFQGKEMQNKEFNDGSGLEEYDFEARYYDPQIGRWHVQDPADQFASPYLAMGNNPPKYIDPDGRFIHIIIGAIIGGVVNLTIHALEGKIHSVGDGFAAFGIGAAAGALGAATGGATLVASGIATTTIGGAIAGGALTGFAGATVGSVVQGVGNATYFGDPYSPENLGRDMLFGAVFGGAVGGASYLLKNGSFAPVNNPDNTTNVNPTSPKSSIVNGTFGSQGSSSATITRSDGQALTIVGNDVTEGSSIKNIQVNGNPRDLFQWLIEDPGMQVEQKGPSVLQVVSGNNSFVFYIATSTKDWSMVVQNAGQQYLKIRF